MTRIPEVALDEEKKEHVKLARAFSRVARHYDIPGIDPVTRDWLFMLKALAIIYGSHWAMYQERMRSERARDVTPKKPLPAGQPQPAPSSQNGTAQSVGPKVATVTIPGFEHLGPVQVKH